MVARLKLKEIDGKAPPGVTAVTLRLKASPEEGRWCPQRASRSAATPPNCGEPLKLQLPSPPPKGVGGQVDPGYGDNAGDATMGYPHPSP
jgi:hypothetical protein